MANVLSVARGLLAVPFAYWMWRADAHAAHMAALVLALAILSDLIDGPLARRRGTASALGRSLDHGADVSFVLAGLGGAAARGAIPIALPLVVAAAFAQYALDSYWLHREGELRMSRLGRWNGILYFAPLVIDVTSRVGGFGTTLRGPLEAVLPAVCWGLVGLSCLSMIDRATSLRRARAE